MAATAFLFPGQGSQAVGMASALMQKSHIARNILSEIDDALNFKLSTLMAEGPAEDLQLTKRSACSICKFNLHIARFAGTVWKNYF